jgi:hypothetical protein
VLQVQRLAERCDRSGELHAPTTQQQRMSSGQTATREETNAALVSSGGSDGGRRAFVPAFEWWLCEDRAFVPLDDEPRFVLKLQGYCTDNTTRFCMVSANRYAGALGSSAERADAASRLSTEQLPHYDVASHAACPEMVRRANEGAVDWWWFACEQPSGRAARRPHDGGRHIAVSMSPPRVRPVVL